MAYNLQPLITILERILNPQQTLWIVDDNKPQLQSLLQKSASLQQILDKSSLTKIESLESQIRDAAHKAEDMIESHMVDQMLSNPEAPIQIPTQRPRDVILDHKKPQPKSLLKKMAYNVRPLFKKIFNPKAENIIESHMVVDHMLSNLEAENMIESHMVVDQMLSNAEAASLAFSTPDLQQVMQELDSVMEQVVNLIEEKTMSSGGSSSGMSFSRDLSSKDLMQSKALVGVDEDLLQLKDRLTGDKRKLEVVPIVGMGGIGKTTLALNLYHDELIVEHFQYRAWTTVSQDYDIRAVLSTLLRCITGNESNRDIADLKDELYRSLFGRRYIIVLDDVWSITFWDEIRMYLPDSNNGSRIVITTRESEVAKHADSRGVQHHMQLLSESASWDLLRQIVFGEEVCPDELRGIGQMVARDCGGLPLAINVIGGILSVAERSKYAWENIASNVADAIAEADEGFSNILSLSYNHLPNHLKSCFLYMGAFPEDYKISGSRLVRLWVGEGFVKSNGNRSLEEVAEDWLKALIERNLFLVREYKFGKPRLLGMHDLLRDLCIRKSNEDRFLCVKNGLKASSSKPRRVCVHTLDHNASTESMSLARSFILISDGRHRELLGAIATLRLLRVLDLMDSNSIGFPKEIFELVNLRFLALHTYLGSSTGILRLRNLQTFVIPLSFSLVDLPPEIFEMSELRHLKLYIVIEEEDMKKIVPNKLRSISRIELTDSLIRNGFLESIPDIENLGLVYSYNFNANAVDLTHLHKLGTLRLCSFKSLSAFRFPRDLRKLMLYEVVILQSDMTTLSALPNLEVLHIWKCKFESEEETISDEVWEVADGVEFCSLQLLHLRSMTNLVRWKADESNFPRLRYLHLRICQMLEEIPSGIGEIPTLQSIKLYDCSDSAVASARQIVEEQQSEYANYNLKLHITKRR